MKTFNIQKADIMSAVLSCVTLRCFSRLTLSGITAGTVLEGHGPRPLTGNG